MLDNDALTEFCSLVLHNRQTVIVWINMSMYMQVHSVLSFPVFSTSMQCIILDMMNGFLGLLGLSEVGFTCFFFNDTATTEIYTLSLHDALPILTDQLMIQSQVILYIFITPVIQ